VLVPNSQVLAAAVSPVRPSGYEEVASPPDDQPRLSQGARTGSEQSP